MDHFQYKNGILHAENVSLERIAAEVATPVYCYSTATLERHFKVFSGAFDYADTLICFAVKANSNLAVLKTLGRAGAGADVVSEGELRRALAADIPPERIVFSGVGKTAAEMDFAMEAGIHQFNVESETELRTLNGVAGSKAVKAPVSLRINPDIDAKTHEKISTGKAENKFGIPWSRAMEAYRLAASLPHIDVVGVDVHIGSQLTELAPFRSAFERVVELVKSLRAAGHSIQRIDLGGGLGIPYTEGGEVPPLPAAYGAMIVEVVGNLGCQLILEPGRLIAGNAGILLTRILYIKEGENRRFAILDAAMNDLMRPAVYDAYHGILPVAEPKPDSPREEYDFVGPVCETADLFAKSRPAPPLQEGDLIAIKSAGAYGAVMSSTYNTRLLVPETLVKGDQYSVIRPRQNYDILLGLDKIPSWLE